MYDEKICFFINPGAIITRSRTVRSLLRLTGLFKGMLTSSKDSDVCPIKRSIL